MVNLAHPDFASPDCPIHLPLNSQDSQSDGPSFHSSTDIDSPTPTDSNSTSIEQNQVVGIEPNEVDGIGKNRISLVDPFCGTGGLLLEAALLGIPTLGTDLDSRMVAGSGDNLVWLRQNFDAENCVALRTADALSLELSAPASGFVFDPPYGRNSWRSDESLALFIGALARCRDNATTDSRLVTLLPWPPEQIEAMRRGEFLQEKSLQCLGIDWSALKAMIKGTGWAVLEQIPISIHSSLSRLLVVLSRGHPGV
jgi:tRNA G10  N-methylase Trm11